MDESMGSKYVDGSYGKENDEARSEDETFFEIFEEDKIAAKESENIDEAEVGKTVNDEGMQLHSRKRRNLAPNKAQPEAQLNSAARNRGKRRARRKRPRGAAEKDGVADRKKRDAVNVREVLETRRKMQRDAAIGNSAVGSERQTHKKMSRDVDLENFAAENERQARRKIPRHAAIEIPASENERQARRKIPRHAAVEISASENERQARKKMPRDAAIEISANENERQARRKIPRHAAMEISAGENERQARKKIPRHAAIDISANENERQKAKKVVRDIGNQFSSDEAKRMDPVKKRTERRKRANVISGDSVEDISSTDIELGQKRQENGISQIRESKAARQGKFRTGQRKPGRVDSMTGVYGSKDPDDSAKSGSGGFQPSLCRVETNQTVDDMSVVFQTQCPSGQECSRGPFSSPNKDAHAYMCQSAFPSPLVSYVDVYMYSRPSLSDDLGNQVTSLIRSY